MIVLVRQQDPPSKHRPSSSIPPRVKREGGSSLLGRSKIDRGWGLVRREEAAGPGNRNPISAFQRYRPSLSAVPRHGSISSTMPRRPRSTHRWRTEEAQARCVKSNSRSRPAIVSTGKSAPARGIDPFRQLRRREVTKDTRLAATPPRSLAFRNTRAQHGSRESWWSGGECGHEVAQMDFSSTTGMER